MNNSNSSEKSGPSLLLGAGFVLLAGYVLWTRLYDLGLKPVQHDESMFAYYGYGIAEGRGYGFYPILHGPLLEWASALAFKLFGDSDATMRLFPALCGVSIFLALLAFKPALGWAGIFWTSALVAVSPTLTFFSRFCRNDLPFLAMAMGAVAMIFAHSRRPRAIYLFLIPIFLSLATTIKETYVVFFTQLLTFGIFTFLAQRSFLSRGRRFGTDIGNETGPRGAIAGAPMGHWWVLGLGLAAAVLVNTALYSSFFQNRENWNGLYKGFQFWMNENKGRRIEGPYHFYLLHLALYELPILLFWAGCLTLGLTRSILSGAPTFVSRTLGWGWIVLGLAVLPFVWDAELPPWFDNSLHMKYGFHLWMAVQLILLVGISCLHHARDGRLLHSFFDYWAGTSFVIYSYAGEKVPWITAHIALPMALSCGAHAGEIAARWAKDSRISRGLGEKPLSAATKTCLLAFVAVSLGWTLWLSHTLNFRQPGSAIERHTYAASHTEFHEAMKAVVEEAEADYLGTDTRIEFEGSVNWPLHWTLRRFENVGDSVMKNTWAGFIIVDESIWNLHPEYASDYDWTRVRFRHYWQPKPLDWRAMRRLDLLLRSEDDLTPEQAGKRKRARAGWGKAWTALVLRDENVQGEYRWDHLGGIDAYIGRRRDR